MAPKNVTENEPAPYVIYTLDYGRKGVDVQPVGSDGAAWIIKTQNRGPGDPVRLYVTDNKRGKAIYLADYASLPFELAVSLEPITSYPTASLAPPRDKTVAIMWGNIKGE